MEKVISHDGTPIAYSRNGSGTPLVLISGAGAANPVAWPLFPVLAERFTVCAVDRRAHGESGDASDYAIEHEYKDIVAVVDSLGEPAYVLGHSYGGLCALEAALLTPNIRKLILYEPLSLSLPGKPVYPAGFIDRLQALLAAGDREGVLALHYREIAGMSPQEIDQMKSTPLWPDRLAIAHTLPRELRADERYSFDAHRFKDLQIPILLLEGGDSRDSEKKGNEVIAAALPNCRIAVLPGQGHIAMYTAPEIFLQEVLGFLFGH